MIDRFKKNGLLQMNHFLGYLHASVSRYIEGFIINRNSKGFIVEESKPIKFNWLF